MLTRRRLRLVVGALGSALLVLLALRLLGAFDDGSDRTGPHGPLTMAPYVGHGAWIDVFDYLPALSGGEEPALGIDAIDEMADAGVQTVYLQAGFEDDATPELLTDEALLGDFLAKAHGRDLAVVGWYLPRFADIERDLEHLVAIREAEIDGHRFDGLAVDIEFTGDVANAARRSDRLVRLSTALDERFPDDVLGAIVLPPVLTEVINEEFWPEFPWRRIAPRYDVWLPMSYWSQRTERSGYREGYRYNEESTRRLRANLDDEDAVVHAIGGIGDEVGADEIVRFSRSLVDTAAVGGSIYDWNTLGRDERAAMTDAFESGSAADLPGR